MTKIINHINTIVDEMVQGFYFENKETVHCDLKNKVIFRKNPGEQVAIISGGGSGHEPAHMGYVGEGMLSAAVCGQIFVPPTPEQVLAAIRHVDVDKGVLLIIKNFKADVESFLAAEALAKKEGRHVDHVIVEDDVSVEEDCSYNKRKRGVAGTVLVHKILGAAACEGYSLKQLKELGNSVVRNLHTLGVALTPANNPEKKEPPFSLRKNEVYFGIGIHGEKGYRKESFSSSERLAIELINKLRSLYRWERNDKFAVLINGLGATPLMEQYIFSNDIRRLLELEGLDACFVKVGTYLTSIDMKGISLSLLRIDDPEWIKWLKASVEVPKW